jgi:hypothetical protein
MSYLYSYRHNLTQLLEQINLQKPSIKIPTFVTHDLVDTYQICRLIDDFIYKTILNKLKMTVRKIEKELDQV